MARELDSARNSRSTEAEEARLVSVASGKGGVGKSVFVANLGMALASLGQRVLLVDTDLSGANLHTLLGIAPPPKSLADFSPQREIEPEKLVVSTDIPNLFLIAGGRDRLGGVHPEPFDSARLLHGLRRFPAEWVLLDLPSGARSRTVELFSGADEGIVMLTPVPTAVENTYQFLRAAYFQKVRQAMATPSARGLIDKVLDRSDERGIRTPLELLAEVGRHDAEEGKRFREAARAFRPKLLVNRVRTAEEINLGFSMRCVCGKYFGCSAEYLGYINADPLVGDSVVQGQPVFSAHPNSDASVYLRRIAQKLSALAGFSSQTRESVNAGEGGVPL